MAQDKQERTYTPMMQQYLEIKEDYADAIVFFRLGDFYEMFFDDAILASKVLEIALTSRDAGENVPMCGVPYHAVNAYLQKLIEKGFKVAIAEQVSEPGKGLVKREVVRLITPGTVFEEGLLDARSNNFIAGVVLSEKGYALSYVDLSTGESYLLEGLDKKGFLDQIMSHGIKEVVLPAHFDESVIRHLKDKGCMVSINPDMTVLANKRIEHLSLDQKRAVSHLLNYLVETQKRSIDHLMPFERIEIRDHMTVDYRVKKHLEIMESLTSSAKTTLLYWLNRTATAMGSRRLIDLLNHPIVDRQELNERYDLIEAFTPYAPREELRSALAEVYDINRIVGRIHFQATNARDLDQLKRSLMRIPAIKEALRAYRHPRIDRLVERMDEHRDLVDELEKAIRPSPPLTVKEGGIIKEGYSDELDELKNIETHGRSWLKRFEEEERERTGIKNLRIGYNRVFGYYIEISKGNIHLVKEDFGYERKQTLANSERYITASLKEQEDLLLHAKERSIALEYEIFKDLRAFTERYTHSLQELSRILADVDVYLNLASIAEKNQYVRPELNDQRTVRVRKGRHPVVEQFTTFVANDVDINSGEILLITGPNMSGKSTYMRMFAIIVYLAQCGFFVPAESASLPVYDALFTRIGSSDDLSGGKSTFMVEMVESNEALVKATNRSLILFDEIGRGTATYDGMALAQGMIEYIHERIGAQTLFSTHYHELTVLDQSLARLKNLSVKAKEENDRMVFLYHVEPGTTDKSYGIQVASLAHLPKSLIARSKKILEQLENKENRVVLDLFNYEEYEQEHEHTIDADQVEILNDIENVDIDQMTPLDALLLLKHYQNTIKSKK
ncbi:MAG: DNA mismatch repair protein MutS [Acholeplasmataceae bacterium]